MTDKVNTLLNQLRESNRIYQGLADQETARKLADLLEEAVSGKAPQSTRDILMAAARRLINQSILARWHRT
jgi:hypothetical protein